MINAHAHNKIHAFTLWKPQSTVQLQGHTLTFFFFPYLSTNNRKDFGQGKPAELTLPIRLLKHIWETDFRINTQHFKAGRYKQRLQRILGFGNNFLLTILLLLDDFIRHPLVYVAKGWFTVCLSRYVCRKR